MSGISNQPVPNTAGGATAEKAAASADSDIFRPHQNLKPIYLEKNATHVEVTTFCEMVDSYIRTGYRGEPPQDVWYFIKPNMHSVWYTALEQNGVKDEGLEQTLKMIMEESSLRNPIHNRRIEFLQSKRGGMSHSDFWALLEERISLLD